MCREHNFSLPRVRCGGSSGYDRCDRSSGDIRRGGRRAYSRCGRSSSDSRRGDRRVPHRGGSKRARPRRGERRIPIKLAEMGVDNAEWKAHTCGQLRITLWQNRAWRGTSGMGRLGICGHHGYPPQSTTSLGRTRQIPHLTFHRRSYCPGPAFFAKIVILLGEIGIISGKCEG